MPYLGWTSTNWVVSRHQPLPDWKEPEERKHCLDQTKRCTTSEFLQIHRPTSIYKKRLEQDKLQDSTLPDCPVQFTWDRRAWLAVFYSVDLREKNNTNLWVAFCQVSQSCQQYFTDKCYQRSSCITKMNGHLGGFFYFCQDLLLDMWGSPKMPECFPYSILIIFALIFPRKCRLNTRYWLERTKAIRNFSHCKKASKKLYK